MNDVHAIVAFLHVMDLEDSLMLAQASHAVDASVQAVDDVAAKHAELTAAGVACSAIAHPSFNPRGEFRINDPDGYALFVAHTEP